MKFPSKIIIHNQEYDIRYVQDCKEVSPDLSDDDTIGHVSYVDKMIRLQALSPIETLDTLIHEILHAILYRNQALRKSIKRKIGEEAFVNTLSDELVALLVNNGLELPTEVEPTEKRIIDES